MGSTEADTLMEQAVVPYIEQMSGNVSTLDITLHPEVVRASMGVAHYVQMKKARTPVPMAHSFPHNWQRKSSQAFVMM